MMNGATMSLANWSYAARAFRRRSTSLLPLRACGWNAFWPDLGAETARFGERSICGMRSWPRWLPLGVGWHVR